MLAYILALAVGLGSLGIYLAAFFFPEVHRKNDFIWSGVGLFYALVLWVCAGQINGGLLLGQVAGVALLGWAVTQTLQLRRQLTPVPQQTELPSTQEVKNTVQEQVSKLPLPQRFFGLGQRLSGSATAAKNRLQQTIDTDKREQSDAANATDAAKSDVASTTPASPFVEVIDHRTPIPEQVADTAVTEVVTDTSSEVVPETKAENEPVLTEEEAIAQAIENTSDWAEEVTTHSSELVRPNPPDPELVEAAIHDAEEKHQEAHPPKTSEHDSEQTDKPAASP